MLIKKVKLIMEKEKEFEIDIMKDTEDVFNFLTDKIKLDKEPEEVAYMLALDSKLNIISCCDISRGDLNTSIVNPREVFKRALVSNAKSIIVAHNHPSGDSTPSLQDKVLTSELKKAGKILGISLIDHIIVGNKEYYSFYENNPDLIEEEKANKFYEKHHRRYRSDEYERSM